MDPTIRELAAELAQDPGAPAPLRLRQATVQSVSGATLGIRVAGSSTTVTGVRYVGTYTPAVNDVVHVLQNGPDLLVVGKLGPPPSPFLAIAKWGAD